MKDIIDELYDLHLSNHNDTNNEDKEYQSTLDRLIKLESELLKTYPDCKELLEEFQTADGDLHSIANRIEFRKGFKVGAQLVLEMIKPIR
ncbi:MAG: myb domain-containing protein [Oscillospiraceae bacterium]|nr:myb domain-containing protein [Oscillospiraceae bacterium]